MLSYTNKPIHPLLTSVPSYIFPSVINRLFAAVIDLLCLVVVTHIFLGLAGLVIGSLNAQSLEWGSFGFFLFLIVRAGVLYVFATTPGLSLYGLRVVSSIDLGPPTLRSLLLRTPFQFTMVLLLSLWFIRHRMTVYDMVCNVTYVPGHLLVIDKSLGHEQHPASP